MMTLHRHQIAWLSRAGWRKIQDRDWDEQARNCLTYWATRSLPLVVTRQGENMDAASVALGLPAPGRWNHRRLALSAARSDVLYFDEFAPAERVVGLLSASVHPSWKSLCTQLKATDTRARVYGSYGWQLLSGLGHVRAGSDIDLWLSVSDADQADAVAACLQSFASESLRLDGELMFADGWAVAWREWLAWRAGRAKALLVKSITGSALVRSPTWQSASETAMVAYA